MIIRCGINGILLFIFVFLFVNPSLGQNNFGKVRCICIDAGHGGRDPGACGLKSQEKDIVLNIALKLGKMIEEEYPGIKLVYTRDRDVLIDLDKRGKIANENKADLFISIHINSNASKSPNGIETYVLGLHRSEENLRVAMKENAAIKYEKDYTVKYAGFDPARAESYIMFNLMQNVYLEKSLHLAALVQEELVGKTKKTDRGVRQAGYLVLKDAAMPAILVEACFISNAEEERFLNTQAAQNKIAASIFVAIGKYKNAVEKNSVMLTGKEKEEIKEKEIEEEIDLKQGTEAAGGLFYAVQIASASQKIENPRSLGVAEKVKELITDKRYRYYVGESTNYNDVKSNLVEIKRKIKDCFIIAIYNGDIIPVSEAKKLEQK